MQLYEYLQKSDYLGRGIFIGKSGGTLVVCYFISGRSANSKNRVFVAQENGVKILPFDPLAMQDPSLVIYSPLLRHRSYVIVSNGDQSEDIFQGLQEGKDLSQCLKKRCFEPDSPHFTPRISGVLDLETHSYALSILKSREAEGLHCNKFFYEYESKEGYGHFLHTYKAEVEGRLLSFEGEPIELELPQDLQNFPQAFWESLNQDYKVSACVKFFDLQEKTFLFNQNKE